MTNLLIGGSINCERRNGTWKSMALSTQSAKEVFFRSKKSFHSILSVCTRLLCVWWKVWPTDSSSIAALDLPLLRWASLFVVQLGMEKFCCFSEIKGIKGPATEGWNASLARSQLRKLPAPYYTHIKNFLLSFFISLMMILSHACVCILPYSHIWYGWMDGWRRWTRST